MVRFLKKGPKVKRVVYSGSRRRTEYVRFTLSRSSSEPTPVHSSGFQSIANESDSIPCSSESSMQISVDEADNGPLTRYQSKRQKLAEAWSALRANLLDVRVEELSPATHSCSKCCREEQEIIRCLDCSTVAYYCQLCCNEVHQTVLFHTPQIWKDILFVPFVTKSENVLSRKDHEVCESSYLRSLCVVDCKGTQHKVKMQFCHCEKEAVTILRYGLWPATPELPRVAIHLYLMEQATMLQLEGQLSLRAFCDALSNMKRYQIHDISEGCSSFQAGNILTSKIKNSKLDVTGIFGSVCKHEFPLLSNMRHGERLSYAVNLLENFIRESQKKEKIIAMNDIACMLHKHLLKNGKDDILDSVNFCVPVFHSFAHNMSCQLQYGQRNVTRTGLTDGEGTERLWSYLRKFSKITKEMNLDNRQDLLVDALFHYSEKLKLKLCSRLEQKHMRAIEQKNSSLQSLKNLTNGGDLTSMEKYCSSLFQFYQIRDKVNALPENAEEDESTLKKELERLEKQLVGAEKKMKFTERWTVTNENFQLHLKLYREKKKTGLIESLKDSATERSFLLSLMKKYADGQDIALRVGRKLQQTNQKINQRLKELNELDGTRLNFADVSTPSNQIYQPAEDTNSTLKLQAIDWYTSYMRAEEEITSSSVEMKAYLAWAYKQEKIIMEEISSLQNVEKDRAVLGKVNCLLLLKLQYEKLIENASLKFSPIIEIQHNKMPVMHHVMQCMNILSFHRSVSDDELQDILKLFEVYDAEVEEVDTDADIVNDLDAELDIDS